MTEFLKVVVELFKELAKAREEDKAMASALIKDFIEWNLGGKVGPPPPPPPPSV